MRCENCGEFVESGSVMEELKKREKMDKEEKKEEAKARARGVKPVAKGASGRPSASVRWETAIKDSLPACGGNKMKAVALANRNNPGLREAMLAEVNGR